MKSALTQIPEKIQAMLKDYAGELEEAWARLDEEPLIVSFGIKIGMDKRGRGTCEIAMNFVAERVKDKTSFFWDDRQGNIMDHIKKVDYKLKKDGMSMTIKATGHDPVTLGAEIPPIETGINQTVPDSELPEDKNEFYTRKRKPSENGKEV
jgi:hypothetical protein